MQILQETENIFKKTEKPFPPPKTMGRLRQPD
jgi:hypothetical protein